MGVVGRNILVVGIADKGNVLSKLPVQVIAMDTGAQAICCLKEEKISTVISHWDLRDVPSGNLLKSLKEARPSMPTIAFIKPNDFEQEIAARRLGVDAVLSDDIDDGYFRDTVCQVLGISTMASMQLVDNYGQYN